VPRFYFHLRAGDQFIRDDDGQDLADASAAKLEAISCAREIVAGAIRSGHASVPDAFVIADERGQEIDIVPLAMVLPESLKN
jgi:hypothetical protein